jgi:acetyltransferase-like isoleucine patch superfamily enzyme
MSADGSAGWRVVAAVHGARQGRQDPTFEQEMGDALRESVGAAGLIEIYSRFSAGDGVLDVMMRRIIWRALARRCGPGLTVGSGTGFKHPETFEIGVGVFIGAQAYVQGRYDGRCVIGDHVWIGPQSYLDARDLVIGEAVGWGPGAKVLGSEHTGEPTHVPIIATDLIIKPVRVEAWADIGTNATLLPGVTIGKGALVGAGSVVTTDVEPFTVVAGVPARPLRSRTLAEAQSGLSKRGAAPS